MERITPVSKVGRTTRILLLAVLILTSGSCGDRETPSGEGETPPAETGKEPTPAKTGGGAVPADIISITLGLIPHGDTGASGTATLTDTSGGLEVTLNVRNLPGQPGAEHLTHIHEGGTCVGYRVGNEAPVRYPLEPLTAGQAGSGSSTTAIPGVTVVQLFSGAPKYIDVHAETTGDEAPLDVSCADIYTTTGGD